MITLTLRKAYGQFEVDDKTIPGSPPVGRGRTMKTAIGDYFFNNQQRFGIQFDVDKSAKPAENRRRRRELENYR